MITGVLTVAGAAVASLSLIISLYMRPEETYRSRYRLMMKEMVSGPRGHQGKVVLPAAGTVQTRYRVPATGHLNEQAGF